MYVTITIGIIMLSFSLGMLVERLIFINNNKMINRKIMVLRHMLEYQEQKEQLNKIKND